MKRIVKGTPPAELTQYILQHANDEKPPTYLNFKHGKGRFYRLRKILIEEQHGLCCYCTNRITLVPLAVHVEHLSPRSLDRDNLRGTQLDYYNLLASCEGKEEQSSASTHCGHLKDKGPETEAIISPLQSDVERFFTFSEGGSVRPSVGLEPAQKQAALTTISKLGLDCTELRDLRQRALITVLGQIAAVARAKGQGGALVYANTIKKLDKPSENNELAPFAPVLIQLLQIRLAAMS